MSFTKIKKWSLLIFVYVYTLDAYASILNEETISIDLKQSVYVFSSTVLLKDIAIISKPSGEDKAGVIEELKAIVIGGSPKPGVPMFVTKDIIVALINRAGLVDHKGIAWGQENIVKINSHGELLNRELIISVAQQYFEKLLDKRFDEYVIVQAGVIKDKLISKGAVRLDPTFDESKDIAKRNCIWVDVYVDEVLQTTAHVWFKTEVYSDALVAMQSFQQHDHLMPDKLVKRRLNVAGLTGEPLKIEDVATSFRYAKLINIGDIITYESIERTPLIEKGSIVNVTADVGKVKIKNKAVAMSDGEMFEKIMVHNRTNANMYAVVITGDQEVVINVK